MFNKYLFVLILHSRIYGSPMMHIGDILSKFVCGRYVMLMHIVILSNGLEWGRYVLFSPARHLVLSRKMTLHNKNKTYNL